MRRVRNRDVTRVLRSFASIEHTNPIENLSIAGSNAFLNALNVEDDAMIAFGRRHFGKVHAHLGIIAARKRVLPLIVSIDVVQVARDNNLPRDFHRVAVNGRENVHVLAGIVKDLPVVDEGRLVLAVGKHVPCSRILLWSQAVDVLCIWYFDDLIALHDVAANARDTGVRLVVHEKITTVVCAVGERHVRVMKIAVGVGLETVRGEVGLGVGHKTLRQDLQALVRPAPTRC